MVPLLPHARECQRLASAKNEMHGLQTSPVSWLSGDEFCVAQRKWGTEENSKSSGLPVAALRLQWLASEYPLNSRAAATDLHRLPEHEVCGGCGGARGPLLVTKCGRTMRPGWGEQEDLLGVGQKRHARPSGSG